MCNLGEGIYLDGIEKGIEQGIEKGIEQGIEQGIEKGREEKLLENLRSVMAELGLTAEAALRALRVPEADRPRVLSLLVAAHAQSAE